MITRVTLGQVWLPYQYEDVFATMDSLHPLKPIVKEALKRFLISCVINHALPGQLETDYDEDLTRNYLDELVEVVRKGVGKEDIAGGMETDDNHYDHTKAFIKSVRGITRHYVFWDWCVVFSEYYNNVGGNVDVIETIENLDTVVGDEYYHVEVANTIYSAKPIRYITMLELIK